MTGAPPRTPETQAATALGLPVARATWRIDPSSSRVEFVGRHLMITTVKGRFVGITGTIVTDGADPAASSVDAAIDASTINTREPDRDAHLRSSELLDVAHYPLILFRSQHVAFPEGVGGRGQITGDLTVRGVTRPVVLDTTVSVTRTDTRGAARLAFSATSTVNRKDFGAAWSTPLDAGGWVVGDQLHVKLDIQAARTDPRDGQSSASPTPHGVAR